jgi:RimJ/RimL family protein N-acetyltransferase
VVACQDPDMHRFLTDLPWPYGEAEAQQWLAMVHASHQAGHSVDLIITAADDDRLLGAISGDDLLNRRRVASVGYWLAPWARGYGLMAEAVRLLTRWMFTARGIERIELTTAPDNLGSQRVARGAGFRLEGYARAEQRFARDGHRRDSVLFALLPEDLEGVRDPASTLPPPGTSRSRPRIVWLNGTFGAGKTSAAEELKRRRPDLTVYDPEYVGFILREFVAVPTGDFQDLAEWRDGVAAIGASLARHHVAGGVLAPMTLWRREYLLEIFTGLRVAGVDVVHVLIDATDDVLAARIDADTEQPAQAQEFRRSRLADYGPARGWLRTAADLVIDSDRLNAAEVADRIEPLLR